MAEAHALLADRYRLVRQVGSGGMGVVWEAWDERLERPVAIKVLKPQLGLTPEEAELGKNRAMREARITARLHHRNAVPVFDVVEHEGQPSLVMQFLPSVPLSAMLREGGPLGVHEAATIGAQVGSALAAAHQLGIVHRDVKPGNILIADDGTALISDFGISHALGDATLTSTGLVHGTPAYLAPEVARGADSSYASDVFSLGATLYAALEGGPPFGTDSNSIALLYKVASGEFAPPQRAGVLAPVLTEMLRTDPAARPEMKEVASRLAAIEVGAVVAPATLPLLAPGAALEPPEEATGTTQVRANPGPATVAIPPPTVAEPAAAPSVAALAGASPEARPEAASVAAPPAAAPPPRSPSSRPSSQPDAYPPARRRRGWVVAAVALVIGLVILGTALVRGQLGGGGDGSAADPSVARTTTAASPSDSSDPGSESPEASSTATDDPSDEPSDEPSESPSTTDSPSPSQTSTTSSGEPTKSELEDAITNYYALVPGDTDKAWKLLTDDYQSNKSGGRKAYERFWDAIDRVSVSKVKATPPSKVEATITYQRGDSTAVERTSFRLVREDGALKIADSTVLSSS